MIMMNHSNEKWKLYLSLLTSVSFEISLDMWMAYIASYPCWGASVHLLLLLIPREFL